jgi:hypothetical protein
MQLHSHFVKVLLDVREVLNELVSSGLHFSSGNRVVSAGVRREDLLEVVNLAAERGATHSKLVLLEFELREMILRFLRFVLGNRRGTLYRMNFMRGKRGRDSTD